MDARFPIEVERADPEHVRIQTRDAEGFDDIVRELLPPKTAEAALTLKPYLFVKTNPSSETVVACCVRYDVAGAAGPAGQTFCYTENPTAVLTQAAMGSMHEEPLGPGDRRVMALSARFDHGRERDDPYWIPWYREHLDGQYPQAFVKHLRISLDAVILSDGSLYGPNESEFAEHFSKYVETEREIARRIVDSVDTGKSLENTIQALRDERATLRAAFCTVQSIDEADSLWRRNGDESFLRLAREMADCAPFSVRRRNFGE